MSGDEVMLGEEPCVHADCLILDTELGPWTEIGTGSRIVESTVGAYTYTAGNADIIYTDIGKFRSIAASVRINPGNHPMDRVTQHHCTYRRKRFGFGSEDDASFFDWRRGFRGAVGHDVWIGHNATIMPGISIGNGAVVGAGAVVTKNVPDYAIVVGVPARVIRYRFDEEIRAALLGIAWWDWDRATLEARFDELSDVPAFIKAYGPG